MTSRLPYRPPQVSATASCDTPVREGEPASVTGFDETVIATVSWQGVPQVDRSGTATSTAVVTVDGDIDRDSAALVEQALRSSISHHPQTRLDLRRVDFFGAAGARVLVEAHQHAARLGHSFALSGVGGMTRHVLAVVGLDHLIPEIEVAPSADVT